MKLFIVLVLLSVSFSDAKPTNSLGSACPNLVNCFVSPCQVSQCDAYPNATCVADYCGGCNAYWYSDNQFIEECSSPMRKQEISSSSPMTEPAIKSTASPCNTVYCFVDPCAFAKCEKHPKAVCHSNYCGGCNAWFYLDGKRVSCN